MNNDPSTRTRLEAEQSGEAMRLALNAAHHCRGCGTSHARVVAIKRTDIRDKGHGLKPAWLVRLKCTHCGKGTEQQLDRWEYRDACAYEDALSAEVLQGVV